MRHDLLRHQAITFRFQMDRVELQRARAGPGHDRIHVDDGDPEFLREFGQGQIEPADPGRQDLAQPLIAVDVLAGNDCGHIVDQDMGTSPIANLAADPPEVLEGRPRIEQPGVLEAVLEPPPVGGGPLLPAARQEQEAIAAVPEQTRRHVRLDGEESDVAGVVEQVAAELRLGGVWAEWTARARSSSGTDPDASSKASERVQVSWRTRAIYPGTADE